MSLSPGTRLGPYEVVSAIGAGGMGEVYRAKDTNLNRDVALKILPESFALDADRVARFKREAHVLASLNHPNIAAIYGIEASGVQGPTSNVALVMELVDGEDLSTRIARGAIPLEDALPIAKQIADALEAAHEAGVIHRDLKPANIKIRKDGTVKVLDFGLARTMDDGAGTVDLANSPTLTARSTQLGMILGTAAYMSPEQAKGRVVDRRADIWAFGVVLFEMLTGKRAFEGDDITEVLASVLKTDPVWTSVPQNTPASVRRLLRRCLEKDPRKRLSSIGDARLELDEIDVAAAASAPTAIAAKSTLMWRLLPLAAGIVLTAGVAAVMWPAAAARNGELARLSIIAPPGSEMYPDTAGVSISPDGTMVAFVVGSATQSDSQLWVREIGGLSARRLEGANGANLSFWSPDSRRIGFFTSDKLKTIAATGGRAEVLANTPNPRGGAWTSSNVIIYAPEAGGPLYRISASGGKPEPATTLDASRQEYGHRFPSFLPDGEHFLYAALPGKSGQFDIYVGSLDDTSKALIGSMDGAPVYAEPGWLLYARQGVLAAHPFDATTLKLTGEPVSIGDEPTSILDPATSFTAGTTISVSRAGSLAYFTTPSVNTQPTWFDAKGLNVGPLNVPPGHYETVTISPDGTQAVLVRSISPSESTLWLVDLSRGGAAPLSNGHGRNDAPVWSADGKSIIFSSDRDGGQRIYQKTIGDAAQEVMVYQPPVPFANATSWSKDGSFVINQLDKDTAQDLWVVSKAGKATPLAVRSGRDLSAVVSPDGRWFAYSSDVTSRLEVYMDSFPVPGRRVRVSQAGGLGGWWTRDQKQFVFLDDKGRSLWRAGVQTGSTLSVDLPRKIVDLPSGVTAVDMMPDRQRFIAIVPEHSTTGSITVVQNWKAALTKK